MPLNQRQFFLWGTDYAYDVEHAYRLLASVPRETEHLDVALWAHRYGLDRNTETNISVADSFDRAYAMTVDLTRPLILATVPDTGGGLMDLVVDGVHRLYKAHVRGVARLPAFRLTAAESRAITRTVRLIEL